MLAVQTVILRPSHLRLSQLGPAFPAGILAVTVGAELTVTVFGRLLRLDAAARGASG